MHLCHEVGEALSRILFRKTLLSRTVSHPSAYKEHDRDASPEKIASRSLKKKEG